MPVPAPAGHSLGITFRFDPNALNYPAGFVDQYFYDWTTYAKLDESPTDASEIIPPADLSQPFSVVVQPMDGSYSQLANGTLTVKTWQKTAPGGPIDPNATLKCPFDVGGITDKGDGTVSFWRPGTLDASIMSLAIKINWNQSELAPNQVFGFCVTASLNSRSASGLIYTSDPEVEIGPYESK